MMTSLEIFRSNKQRFRKNKRIQYNSRLTKRKKVKEMNIQRFSTNEKTKNIKKEVIIKYFCYAQKKIYQNS